MANSARSLTSVRHTRLRVAAVMYWGARLLLVGVGVAAAIAYFGFGWSDWRVAAGAGGAVILGFLVADLVARPLRCGACGQPTLRHSGKAKHVYASKWLGLSYRARVAWDVITAKDHSCMYCHTRIRHRSDGGRSGNLKLQPPANLPGYPGLGASPAGSAIGPGQVPIFDAALLELHPDSPLGPTPSGPVVAFSPMVPPPHSHSPAPPSAVAINPPPESVPPLPAMTPPAPFPSAPEIPVPLPPLPFPGVATAAVSLPDVPPALSGNPAPVPPPAVPFPVSGFPVSTQPPSLPVVAGAVGGGSPFGKQPFLPATVGEVLATSAGDMAKPPPPPPGVPQRPEPSSFFGPVRPPAPLSTLLPLLGLPAHAVLEPAKKLTGRGEVSSPVAQSIAAITPSSLAAPPPPAPAGEGTVATALPQSMETVIRALQESQEAIASAFQSAISQLRAAMDQVVVATSTLGPVATHGVPEPTPISPVTVPPAYPQPASEIAPSAPPLSLPDVPAGWPALPAASPPHVSTRPPTLPPVPEPPAPASAAAPPPWPTPPALIPGTPMPAPAIASPGIRVYPPLHPVVPAGTPPHAPTSSGSAFSTVPAVEAGPQGGTFPPTPTVAPALPVTGLAPAPPAQSRRRPLPNLPQTLIDELDSTLAQAFAPPGSTDLPNDPGTSLSTLLPVLPLTSAPGLAAPVPDQMPGGFAMPPMTPPPGHGFVPAPPGAAPHAVPPPLPVGDPDHPPITTPFSFLQSVPPQAWPADDLPAVPLSEDPPMWTRTRGKTSLS